MDEPALLQTATEHLAESGITDELLAVGWFYPRGHTGGMFVGGMAGGSAGDLIGNFAGGIAAVGGAVAGGHAVDAGSGLPEQTFVAVSGTRVYLFDSHRDVGLDPGRLFGVLDRSRLEVKVHQRVNVRILELVDIESGSTVELEGSRIPTTHSGDVIRALHD